MKGLRDVTSPTSTALPTMYDNESPASAAAIAWGIVARTFARCSTNVFSVLIANSTSAELDNTVRGTSNCFGAIVISAVQTIASPLKMSANASANHGSQPATK